MVSELVVSYCLVLEHGLFMLLILYLSPLRNVFSRFLKNFSPHVSKCGGEYNDGIGVFFFRQVYAIITVKKIE